MNIETIKSKKEKTPLQLIAIGFIFGFCIGIFTFDIYMTPIVVKGIIEMIRGFI